jgi:peptidoglycan/LPS O-acetylase OafA/YrhL
LRFASLDGWRGLCALVVCLFHLNVATKSFLQHAPLIVNGFIFVDFFFVLSGFVISVAYARHINQIGDLGRFIARRFGRLWPLNTAVLAVWLTIELVAWVGQPYLGPFKEHDPFTGPTTPLALLSHLLLLQSFGLHDQLTWNGPAWSIGAEFWTYVVFGLACLLGDADRRRAAIVLAALGLAVVTLCPRFMDATYDYGFFRCLYGFFLGHLVFRAHLSRHARGGLRPGLASVLELAGVVLVLIFASVAGRDPISLAAPLVFALVVYVFSFEAGALSRLLATTPFRLIGAWSYSIYMLQSLLLVLAIDAVALVERLTGASLRVAVPSPDGEQLQIWLGNNYVMGLFTIVFLTLIVAAASISHRLIEEPSRRRFNDWAGRLWVAPVAPQARSRSMQPAE